MTGFMGNKERNEKLVDLINSDRKDKTIYSWCKKNNIQQVSLHYAIQKDYSPITKFGQYSEISIKLMDTLGCIPEDIWDNEVLYPLETNFCEFDSIDKDVLKYADEDFVSKCPSEYLEAEQLSDRVQEVIEMLFTEKQKEVIRLRFGIERDRDYGLKEIGVKYGLSSERIRQVEGKALRIMRHPSKSDLLLGLIDAFPIDESKPAEKPITKPIEFMQSIHVNKGERQSHERAKGFIEHAIKHNSIDSYTLQHLYYKL